MLTWLSQNKWTAAGVAVVGAAIGTITYYSVKDKPTKTRTRRRKKKVAKAVKEKKTAKAS